MHRAKPWAQRNALGLEQADDEVQLPFVSARDRIAGLGAPLLKSVTLLRYIAPSVPPRVPVI